MRLTKLHQTLITLVFLLMRNCVCTNVPLGSSLNPSEFLSLSDSIILLSAFTNTTKKNMIGYCDAYILLAPRETFKSVISQNQEQAI